jgi:ABC-type nitrate/sulfonate/bicarbonate transport system substrate-binding protein
LARELLARHGLQLDRDYQLRAIGNGAKRLAALCTDTSLAAAILNPPFTAMAQARGLKVLANMDDAVGPYQAGGAFALRSWLAANRALAVAYIRTYIAALQWMLAHPAQARAMLIAKLDLTRDIAAATYAKLCNPVTGFQPRAALSRAGFDRMLQIRAASAPGTPPLTYEACVDDMLYAEAILKQ